MKAKSMGVVVLGSVFLLGAASGWGLRYAQTEHEMARLFDGRGPDHMRERRLVALTRRLHLSEAQRAQVAQIFEADAPMHDAAMRKMQAQCGGEFREAKAKNDARILSLLDPQQRELFLQMKQEHARREGR